MKKQSDSHEHPPPERFDVERPSWAGHGVECESGLSTLGGRGNSKAEAAVFHISEGERVNCGGVDARYSSGKRCD